MPSGIPGTDPGIPPIDMGGVPNVSNPNFLIFVADDAASVEFSPYREDPLESWGETLTLEWMAKRGVLFRNAYAKPLCSPFRASFNTGRYAFRTGIGDLTDAQNRPLGSAEVLLPRMIEDGTDGLYKTASIGKCHLSNRIARGGFETYMCDQGYDYYAGSIANFEARRENYYSWNRTEAQRTPNGVVAKTEVCTNYAPKQNVEDGLAWISRQTGPWVLIVNFNLPHSPYEVPPADLYDTARWDFGASINGGTLKDRYRAMIQAMDVLMGRFINSLSSGTRANTNIAFVADNGTPSATVLPPFMGSHGKRTVYEQGVRVPMIWMGPNVDSPGRESAILVQTEDWFVTIADELDINLATQYPGRQFDGLTFAPHLRNKLAQGLRSYAFSEAFTPNVPHTGASIGGPRMIRDSQYKLMRIAAGTSFPAAGDFMYDLLADPTELVNLLVDGTGATTNLTAPQLTAYNELTAEYVSIVNS